MEEEKLIAFINERIEKYLSQYNIARKYPAVVMSINGNVFFCRIAGYETVMPFPNFSNSTLSVGDNVFIDSTKNDLTNGYISVKFKNK